MAAESASTASGGGAGSGGRIRWREIRRQLLVLSITLAAVVVIALTVSITSIAVQASRDEARSVDVVLAVTEPVPSEALIEHCFELYRRGYGPQLVLVGPGSEGLGAALRERGVAEEALVSAVGAGSETQQLRVALDGARVAGATSVLIAGDGVDMLRRLKLAGDEGMRPYGAPTPGETMGLFELIRGSIGYWDYVLFGR